MFMYIVHCSFVLLNLPRIKKMIFRPVQYIKMSQAFKGMVSRDFVLYFLVSFDRSEVCTNAELVRLLLKFRFHVEFFDFRVSA
jgi:hypothetical protein